MKLDKSFEYYYFQLRTKHATFVYEVIVPYFIFIGDEFEVIKYYMKQFKSFKFKSVKIYGLRNRKKYFLKKVKL